MNAGLAYPKQRSVKRKFYRLVHSADEPRLLPAGNLVCVMDDLFWHLKDATNTLAEFGFKVHQVESAEDAVLLMRYGVRFFVLDVNMGKGREWEGLRAAERLKELDPQTFVAILSAHAQESGVRQWAKRIDVEMVRAKTGNRVADVRAIMERYSATMIERFKKVQDAARETEPMYSEDLNVAAFRQQSKDEAWNRRHAGKFAAFVSGRLVGVFDDRGTMARALAHRFPDRERFYSVVAPDDEEEVLDFPGFENADDD